MVNCKLQKLPTIRKGKTNVYNVLTKVLKILEEEPNRLYMKAWVSRFLGKTVHSYSLIDKMPPCGTVACIAGWICILLKKPKDIDDEQFFNADEALQRLGFENSPNYKEADSHHYQRMIFKVDSPERELQDLFFHTTHRNIEVIYDFRRLIKTHKEYFQSMVITL
jgi:hypothetical protein